MGHFSVSRANQTKLVAAALTPIAVYLLLRLYVRWFLAVKLGFRIGTDFNFVPQMALAYFVFLSASFERAALSVAIRREGLARFVIALALFAMGTAYGKQYVSYQYPWLVAIWFLWAFSVILASAFIWVGPGSFFQRQLGNLWFPAALVGGSGILALGALDFLNIPLARYSTAAVGVVLSRVFSDVVVHVRQLANLEEYSLLMAQHFSISVGKGCSGVEGMSLFGFLYGLLYVYRPQMVSSLHWIVGLFLGLCFFYLINLVRLTAYFLIGYYVFGHYDKGSAYTTMAFLHNTLGWALCLPGLWFFFEWWLFKNAHPIRSPQKSEVALTSLSTTFR